MKFTEISTGRILSISAVFGSVHAPLEGSRPPLGMDPKRYHSRVEMENSWALWERIRYEENNETFSRVSFVVVIHVSHLMYSSDLCIIFL